MCKNGMKSLYSWIRSEHSSPWRGRVFFLGALSLFVLFSTLSKAWSFLPVEHSNDQSVKLSIQETYRLKALELWKQAAALQLAGRYEEALAKYREGLGYHENTRVREHVWKLEETLASRRARMSEKDADARRKAADKWKEAAVLQRSGWFEDALRKFNEGLEIYNDPRVREHVKKLERYIEQLRLRGALPLLV